MRFLLLLLVSVLMTTNHGAAQGYKVMVSSARIAKSRASKEGMKPWDTGLGAQALPDTYVTIELDGKVVFVSGQQKDTLSPRWFTGTDYWSKANKTRVKISLFDADASTALSRIGVAGVCLRHDLPDFGKRLLNRALLDSNRDDLIATWSGSLSQLIQLAGGIGQEGELLRQGTAMQLLARNAGLRSLKVRVLQGGTVPARGTPVRIRMGLQDAQAEPQKRSSVGGRRLPWDVGAGMATAPDLRYVIYVNGEPAVLGVPNQDSASAVWPAPSKSLQLFPEDQIAIEILDADAGNMLKKLGRASILMTDGLTLKQKQQLLEELNQAAFDDPVFLWVGRCKSLFRFGNLVSLVNPRLKSGVWINNGLNKATLSLGSQAISSPRPGRPMKLSMDVLRVSKTKANRRPWDLRGGPDPYVKVSIPAAKGGWQLIAQTKPLQDTWNLNPGVRSSHPGLRPGVRLKVEVFDHDKTGDDLIGTIAVIVPSSPTTLTERAQQVTALSIRFE